MKIKSKVELVGDEKFPKLHIVITVGDKEIHRTFCNFRRYDWCWTPDSEGEYGYCQGLDICNGGSVEIVGQTIEGFYAATLGVAIERMLAGLQDEVKDLCEPRRIEYARWTEEEKDLARDAHTQLYTVRCILTPVVKILLDNAIANRSQYFDRVFEGYAGGVPAMPEEVEIAGFEPPAWYPRLRAERTAWEAKHEARKAEKEAA